MGSMQIMDKQNAKQEQGEPVAVKHMMEWVDYLKRKSDYGQHMQIPSEMSAGACWELAVELEQFINTTPQPKQELVCVCGAVWEGDEIVSSPQQRTWVGLTEEDFVCVHQLCDTPIQAAEYVNHLLKEKNNA